MGNLLPSKLPQYLVRLQVSYSAKGHDLGEIIAQCRYLCVEDTVYDNWNGGMYGHDVALFVPLAQLAKIDVDEQEDVAKELKEKLNKCAQGIENEWFNLLRLELIDENDPECQEATPFSPTPPINPETLSFWKPGLARVFISHRDAHKAEARDLSDALEAYGMACFVAHDTIKPMKVWRHEILKGLQTMEVMLLFLTDDFEDSWYCHQEVGYALGRGVPIISLKLGQKDPPGFVSEVQAARGHSDRPIEAARKLFPLIGEALGRQGRLQDVLVSNFLLSPSYTDAKVRFDFMAEQVGQLTELQVDRIREGFRSNDQLHYSIHLTSKYERLKKFMDRTTGKKWVVEDNELRERKPMSTTAGFDDDVPF